MNQRRKEEEIQKRIIKKEITERRKGMIGEDMKQGERKQQGRKKGRKG